MWNRTEFHTNTPVGHATKSLPKLVALPPPTPVCSHTHTYTHTQGSETLGVTTDLKPQNCLLCVLTLGM